MTEPNKVGNACHVISSASILANTIATLLFAKPGSTFFDNEWVQHGFCVIQQDVPYWNSHDLCLYFDTVLVAIGLLVYFSYRGLPAPAMKTADEALYFGLLGHLGHGVAHGCIASNYRNDEGFVGREQITGFERLAKEEDQMKIVKSVIIGVCFWFGLMKGVVPTISTGALAVASIFIYVMGLFVRDVLGFTYVQAVIAVAFASTQLTLPKEKKDYAYAAFAAVSIPISIIPWLESTACQNVASKFGGHLIYDVSIPVFLTAAYYASWRHYSAESKQKTA